MVETQELSGIKAQHIFSKWCPAEAKEHPPNFSQFIEHCRRVKRQKATKKMIDTYCDKPSFLGGPEK
jgi:hypothetical protein